jgi:NAD(P)-dependent dehydrogenase (short-subunit alcohol dehydrogenase family)
MTTVVVTGGTRGIGAGLARAFLDRGCDVVVCGRDPDGVRAAVAGLGRADRVLGVACDVAERRQVEQLWADAVDRFGRVDVWINNAGATTAPGPLWELDPAEVDAVVDANLRGTMHASAVAISGMLAQGGGRVYTMEGLGSRGERRPGLTTYGATKYAVRYVTKALARATKETSVAVGSISPGMVRTDLLQRSVDPARAARAERVFALLADEVDTVAPWLADRVLADRGGGRIAWLTPARLVPRVARRLLDRLGT